MRIRAAVILCAFALAVSGPALAQPPAPPAPPAPLASPAMAPAPPAPPAAPPMAVEAPAPPAAPAAPVAPARAGRQRPPKPPAAAPAPAAPSVDPQTPPPPPAAPTPPPPGREMIEADPVNVRFEVTISYQAGTAAPIRRSALLTVANNTGGGFPRSSLRSGNNVPVPMTTFTPVAATAPRGEERGEPAPAPAPKPMVSYNYRSVGLNVDVNQAAVLPGNKVRALLNVEFSGVDEKSASTAGAPSFPTFSQSISLYLESGKPVVIAQSSDFVDNVERKQSVEVKATILR